MFEDSEIWVTLYQPSISLPLQQLFHRENEEGEDFLNTHHFV